MFKLLGAVLMLAVMAMPAYAKAPLKALTPGMTILFQGDSITEGGRWPGDDPNHIMGQDYAYIVAARIGLDYPERRLIFLNRGVSGDTVVKLSHRWQADAIALKPDVLSIMVGVNDTFYSEGEIVETYEQTYDALIKDTLAALPNVKIVLGQPFLLPVGGYKADYTVKRAELEKRQAVVRGLAAKYRLPLIDYQRAFDEAMTQAPADHWSWDGVHPTYAGHGLMAREWVKTVNQAWR